VRHDARAYTQYTEIDELESLIEIGYLYSTEILRCQIPVFHSPIRSIFTLIYQYYVQPLFTYYTAPIRDSTAASLLSVMLSSPSDSHTSHNSHIILTDIPISMLS
jgi:hypothetical protein